MNNIFTVYLHKKYLHDKDIFNRLKLIVLVLKKMFVCVRLKFDLTNNTNNKHFLNTSK